MSRQVDVKKLVEALEDGCKRSHTGYTEWQEGWLAAHHSILMGLKRGDFHSEEEPSFMANTELWENGTLGNDPEYAQVAKLSEEDQELLDSLKKAKE